MKLIEGAISFKNWNFPDLGDKIAQLVFDHAAEMLQEIFTNDATYVIPGTLIESVKNPDPWSFYLLIDYFNGGAPIFEYPMRQELDDHLLAAEDDDNRKVALLHQAEVFREMANYIEDNLSRPVTKFSIPPSDYLKE